MKRDLKIVVIVSKWNELITKALLEGALSELHTAGVENPRVFHAPGAWEIPVFAKRLLSQAEPPDAIIALGCIMMGETQHGRLLSSDVSSALMGLQTQYGVPIGWGILSVDTPEQALDRAGLKMGNKGREAALAALETLQELAKITAK